MTGGRECAVKLLPLALKHAPNAWNAFQDLARSVAALDADAVVRISDFALDSASGRPFVVSERIGFPSVAALVVGHGPVPPALWAQALDAFARSLDAAAGSSIFHGDLKPHNLFFSPEHAGWARISDFGMALLRGACAPPSGVASLGWASVEQSRGEPPSRAADIFALGLITFYALTGRHYSAAMWLATPDPTTVLAELALPLASAQAHAAAQGGTLPAALDPWFARALNPSPSQRFASAGEATRVFADLVEQLDRPAIVAPARDTSSGVAAAVAAPLLFQDLPKPSARASSPGPSAASVGHGEAPLSSRPPGFSAPRAATTEHVAGLPAKPPVALLAAAGAGLLSLLALAAFAVSRLLSPSSEVPLPAVSAAPSALSPSASEPATHGSAEPSIPTGTAESAQAAPKTGATFVCAPVSCEWIVCDGENVKKGQLELSLPSGKHSCSASRYGYRTAVTEFQVEAGKSTRVLFELLRAKAAAPAPAKSTSAASKAKIGAETTKKGAASKTTKTAKPAASSKSTKGR
jgi:serine/threonine-protein kinase